MCFSFTINSYDILSVPFYPYLKIHGFCPLSLYIIIIMLGNETGLSFPNRQLVNGLYEKCPVLIRVLLRSELLTAGYYY